MMRCSRKRKQTAIWSRKQTIRPTSSKTPTFLPRLDLSNPATRTWIKGIIKTELIGKAGASGWMADFGEALPFDAKLHGDADPAVWHNRFTEEWAKVHREAIEEAGRGDDIVFFNRSGFTQSPKFSTLFWLGDQMETWDEYDGIKTAVVGLLSGGVSGFSLLHSDTGGYVTLSLNIAGHKIPVVARTDELLQRWMELGAFTSVFRTHEGLDTTIAAQFDSSAANTAHQARFARVYKGLASYRKRLVAEAAEHGYPVVRYLFLHYPDDPNTHALRYQFCSGPISWLRRCSIPAWMRLTSISLSAANGPTCGAAPMPARRGLGAACRRRCQNLPCSSARALRPPLKSLPV
jgi:alpha-glucosidase